MNEFDAMEAVAEDVELEEDFEEAPEEAIPEAPKPYYVTKTALNAALQLEATQAAQSKLSRILTYCCFGVLVLLLGATVWMYVKEPATSYLLYLVLEVLVLAYVVYTHFFGQKRSLQKWERQIQSQYGVNALHLTSEFYDLTFMQNVAETGNDMDCGYSSIEKIEETEHIILLRCGKNRWFFVEKSGVEDVEGFRAFIHEKCGV